MKSAQRIYLALAVTLTGTLLPGTEVFSQVGARHTRPAAQQPRTSPKAAAGTPARPASPARQEWEQKRDWSAFVSNTFGDTAVKDSLKQLLDSGVDVNTADRTGRAALHLAATLGQTELARYLLSRGARVGARDRLGRTPLMLSAGLGGFNLFSGVASPWSAFRVDPLCPDREIENAAARTRKQLLDWYTLAPAYPPLVGLLIEAGADVNGTDLDGLTPLDYAGGGGPTEIDRLIWASGRVQGGQQCVLKPTTAPALRGFRLGMSVSEVSDRFPRYGMPQADPCGRQTFSLDTGFSRLRAFARRPEEFDGVRSVRLAFLDGRLTYVRVTYEGGTEWRSVGEYLASISNSLRLPASWHKTEDGTIESHAHVIGCDGFKVVAGFDAGPYVELHETTATQAAMRRKVEYDARREREAEEERERQRRAFKP
jgi:Ankyrin repeats (3 copies)